VEHCGQLSEGVANRGKDNKEEKGGNDVMVFKMKKGQVAVWVILGLVLVASVALFYIIDRDVEFERLPVTSYNFDVESFIDNCIAEDSERGVDVMLSGGGFTNPKNSVFFGGKNIEYLCENSGYYEPCINQHPVLLDEIKVEIRKLLLPKIDRCFDEMKKEFEKTGSEVVYENEFSKLGVELGQDRIFLKINRGLVIKKEGDVREFNELNIALFNPVYNLASIAIEIATQEARYCNFEYVGYSILHPRYEINKFVMSDSTVIYSIKDSKTGKEMKTAIRGCAIPAGF
jgi:hypothetical protein